MANINEKFPDLLSAIAAGTRVYAINDPTGTPEEGVADMAQIAALVATLHQPLAPVTVAALAGLSPAAGWQRVVSDADAPAVGSAVEGGGSSTALVWYNGSAWTVIGV